MVSRDGLRVIIRVEFQYQIRVEDIEEVTRKYRNQERWKRLVVTKAVSAVQKGYSLFFTSSFQAERGIIQERMLEALIEKLADVHALAVGLQLSFVELPAGYSKAVAAKQAANEDIGLAINQREQQRTIAEQALQTATEQAKKINDAALNDKMLLVRRLSCRPRASRCSSPPRPTCTRTPGRPQPHLRGAPGVRGLARRRRRRRRAGGHRALRAGSGTGTNTSARRGAALATARRMPRPDA